MLVRKARLKDIPIILKMWKEFIKDHDCILIKKNPKLESHLTKTKNAKNKFRYFIQKNIRSRNGVVFIAEVEEKPVGYSLNYIKKNIPIFKLEKIGHMSDLFVKKEYRGMKISSKFKEEAMRWFKEKGVKYISIKVFQDNKHAHSIYDKWRFFDYKMEMRKNI